MRFNRVIGGLLASNAGVVARKKSHQSGYFCAKFRRSTRLLIRSYIVGRTNRGYTIRRRDHSFLGQSFRKGQSS